MVNGQINLRDAIRRQIDFETGGKKYKLSENPATLIVRYVVFKARLVLCLTSCRVDLEAGISTSHE